MAMLRIVIFGALAALSRMDTCGPHCLECESDSICSICALGYYLTDSYSC